MQELVTIISNVYYIVCTVFGMSYFAADAANYFQYFTHESFHVNWTKAPMVSFSDFYEIFVFMKFSFL